MNENKEKPNLVFTRDKNAKPAKPVEEQDTMFEDTAKSIAESKIAIDSLEDSKEDNTKCELDKGGVQSARFVRNLPKK